MLRPLIALALLLLVAGCDKRTDPSPQGNVATSTPTPASAPKPLDVGTVDLSQRGSAMPSDGFVGADGRPTTLAAFKGKPVLVNLWATWCGPCVREMPSLDALAARTAGKLEIVAVSQDAPGPPDPVPAWWAKAGLKSLKLYRDPKTNLGFAYNGGQLPTSILYDAQGREVWRIAGGLDWAGPRGADLLAEVLKS